MATFWEIANDLEAQARRFEGTGNDALERSLRRGAKAIRDLLEQLAELSEEAEAAAERYEAYVVRGEGR